MSARLLARRSSVLRVVVPSPPRRLRPSGRSPTIPPARTHTHTHPPPRIYTMSTAEATRGSGRSHPMRSKSKREGRTILSESFLRADRPVRRTKDEDGCVDGRGGGAIYLIGFRAQLPISTHWTFLYAAEFVYASKWGGDRIFCIVRVEDMLEESRAFLAEQEKWIG